MLRIFGPNMGEGAGGWRRLHNELHNLYTSPNIIRVNKSRRMRRRECSKDGRYKKGIRCYGLKT